VVADSAAFSDDEALLYPVIQTMKAEAIVSSGSG